MKKQYLILLLLLSVSGFSQKNRLGKVTIDELKEKKHSKDTSAVAALLFKNGETYFEYDQDGRAFIYTEVEAKIKIYKKEGYEWGTHEVAYYVGGHTEELVRFSNAFVYNLEGGQIVKTKLKSDGEFVEEVNESWKKKKIAFPNVKEGSIIEFSYILKSPYIVALPTWEFQYKIPVDLMNYTTRIPEYYEYNNSMRGSLTPKVSKIRQNNTTFNYFEAITTYVMQDVPALKDERYVNNLKNYTSSIEHELSSAKQNNGIIKKYAQSWDDVVKSISENDDFGGELKIKSYFENDINLLIADAKTENEKINAIFTFVKDRMHWNERYSYSCKNGVRRAYKEKVGDVAEINLMLTAMLRHAGVNANPVILSTRQNGIAFFPSRTAFNYVVCGVESKGDIILLDATTKNAVPNILPSRALNWLGRIIRQNNTSTEISLMPKIISKQSVNIIASIDAEGKITGKAREQHTDYNAYLFRENYLNVAKESYLESLEKRYDGMQIDEYATTNDKDLLSPMVENYSFIHDNVVEKIGGKIYFSPMLFHISKENPFTQEERTYPVDFSFPYQDNYMFNVTIPEGYAIETLPSPVFLAMENNLGTFKYNITSVGDKVQIKAVLDITQPSIGAENYGTLKDFYKAMIEKQNEKVVLKKV